MLYGISYNLSGRSAGYHCEVCSLCNRGNFPVVQLEERIKGVVSRFLEEEFLPRIEKRGGEKQPIHEAGWSLSYHGTSCVW